VRVLATADLHYDVWRSRKPTERLAREMLAAGGDVLILAGDTAGILTEKFSQCLELFDRFPGRKLLVPGNHCIWVHQGQSSWDKYQNILPLVAGEHGFEYLDCKPALLAGVGFVGNMGWYDYSYRDEALGIPERFYRNKVSPGAAARLPRYQHLLDGYSDITAPAAAISARWMDGQWVKWTFSDPQLSSLLAHRFAQQLRWAAQRAKTIVAVTHHLPFERMLKRNPQPAWRFANAFMGTELFGQAMLEQEKCRLAICGHSHRSDEVMVGDLRCVNIGSTYRHKRFISFDL